MRLKGIHMAKKFAGEVEAIKLIKIKTNIQH